MRIPPASGRDGCGQISSAEVVGGGRSSYFGSNLGWAAAGRNHGMGRAAVVQNGEEFGHAAGSASLKCLGLVGGRETVTVRESCVLNLNVWDTVSFGNRHLSVPFAEHLENSGAPRS